MTSHPFPIGRHFSKNVFVVAGSLPMGAASSMAHPGMVLKHGVADRAGILEEFTAKQLSPSFVSQQLESVSVARKGGKELGVRFAPFMLHKFFVFCCPPISLVPFYFCEQCCECDVIGSF